MASSRLSSRLMPPIRLCVLAGVVRLCGGARAPFEDQLGRPDVEAAFAVWQKAVRMLSQSSQSFAWLAHSATWEAAQHERRRCVQGTRIKCSANTGHLDQRLTLAQVKLWGGYELPEVEAQRVLLEQRFRFALLCLPSRSWRDVTRCTLSDPNQAAGRMHGPGSCWGPRRVGVLCRSHSEAPSHCATSGRIASLLCMCPLAGSTPSICALSACTRSSRAAALATVVSMKRSSARRFRPRL